jgi:hypothetical protein
MYRWGHAVVGLGLSVALLHPARVVGQTLERTCLTPAPYSFGDPFFPRTDDPKRGETRGGSATYISGRGELCRALPYSPSDETLRQVASDRAPGPGKAFVFSSILPGAGQWYLGKNRWPAYVAVEAWAWIQFLDWRREGHKLQRQYKDLAWYVARRVSTGLRTDAGWDYYEAMTYFQASGAYDSDPLTPGVQPEEDTGTFNGSIWALAQEIYLPGDPDNPPEEGSEALEKAYNYYLSRAYAPNLAWDWGANTLHQDEYGTLIREADEALRSSTSMIGVILANHLLSAVDALVAGRLGIAGEADPSVEFALRPGPMNLGEVVLQFRIPDPLAYVH